MNHKPIVLKSGTELPLTDMRGKPYLQVAYRLVWFREEHADWTIKTHLSQLTAEHALVEAEIFNEAGRLIASDRKLVTQKSFQAYVEKATTGAIGRALALCGYGTQFDPEEFDDETNIQHVADTPVARPMKPVWKFGEQQVKELDDALAKLGQNRDYAKIRCLELCKKNDIRTVTEDEYLMILNSLVSEGAMK